MKRIRSNILIFLISTLVIPFTFFQIHGQNNGPLNEGVPDSSLENDDKGLRSIQHNSFQAGEVLKYRVRYGMMHAGKAVVKVEETDKKVRGRELLRMVGTGRSKGTFDWFFKVRDHYETLVDKKGVFPWVFVRRVNEGGYKIMQDYTFYQHKNKVKAEYDRGWEIDKIKNSTFETPDQVQDILSSFYYVRTLDLTNAKPGKTYEVKCFMDEEVFPFRIKYLGRDTIKTHLGRFSALKFCPVVQEGRIFDDEDDLTVWITDDGNNVPIAAHAKILVGSIKMELDEYKGLVNPISKLE